MTGGYIVPESIFVFSLLLRFFFFENFAKFLIFSFKLKNNNKFQNTETSECIIVFDPTEKIFLLGLN